MKKTIQIKTNLLTIVIVFIVLMAAVVFFPLNGVQNLVFTLISADQVDSVTVHQQFDEANALLTEGDTQTLLPMLKAGRLTGESVRLFAGESINPQYTVRLKNGISFDIACYEDHYIIDGRGYPVSDRQKDNYTAIGRLYVEHLSNRTYFPRTKDGEG